MGKLFDNQFFGTNGVRPRFNEKQKAMLQSTAFLGEISTKYRSLSSRWISRDPHPKLGWASVFAHTHTDD